MPGRPAGFIAVERGLGNAFLEFQRSARKNDLCDIGSRLNHGETMNYFINTLWSNDEGQDVAEYSVMLAVILVIVVGAVRLIGSNANNVFSQIGSAVQ